MSLSAKINNLILDGHIRIKDKKCRDCRMPVTDEILSWMLEHWLHFTHCAFCGEPLRVNVSVLHGADGHHCWKIEEGYPDAEEVQRGNCVSMVHEKCWKAAHKPRKAQ